MQLHRFRLASPALRICDSVQFANSESFDKTSGAWMGNEQRKTIFCSSAAWGLIHFHAFSYSVCLVGPLTVWQAIESISKFSTVLFMLIPNIVPKQIRISIPDFLICIRPNMYLRCRDFCFHPLLNSKMKLNRQFFSIQIAVSFQLTISSRVILEFGLRHKMIFSKGLVSCRKMSIPFLVIELQL